MEEMNLSENIKVIFNKSSKRFEVIKDGKYIDSFHYKSDAEDVAERMKINQTLIST